MRFLLIVFGILCMYWGGTQVYVAQTNSKPTEISLIEYMQKGHSARWLKLTRVRMNLLDSFVVYNKPKKRKLSEEEEMRRMQRGRILVPLIPDQKGWKGTPRVFVEIYDKKKADLVREMMKMPRKKLLELVRSKPQEVILTGNVQGFVQDVDSKTARLLRREYKVQGDLVVVAENQVPGSIEGGVAKFLFGLLLVLGWGIWLFRDLRQEEG